MADKFYSNHNYTSNPLPTGRINRVDPDSAASLPFTEQSCPKCNGEGYIVVRVYPWDGCSYDEKPCDLCNPYHDDSDVDASGGVNAR